MGKSTKILKIIIVVSKLYVIVVNRLPYTPTSSEERPVNDTPSSTASTSATGLKYNSSSSAEQGNAFVAFDEKEEWNKISKIIDSFGADIGASAKASITPHNCK